MTSPRRRSVLRVAIALVVSSLLASCSGDESDSENPKPVPTTASASQPPGSGHVRTLAYQDPVYDPCGIESTVWALYVLSCSGTVLEVDPATGESEASALEESIVSASLAMEGSVAIAAVQERPGSTPLARLYAADEAGLRPLTSDRPSGVSDIGVGGLGLFVATLDGQVLQVSGKDLKEVTKFREPLIDVAVGAENVFALSERATLVAIDPADDATSRSSIPGSVLGGDLAVAPDDRVWIASSRGLWTSRAGEAVQSVDVPGDINAIEPCGQTLWISQPRLGVTPEIPRAYGNSILPVRCCRRS